MGGAAWTFPEDGRWDCLTTVFCPPDSRTGQSVHCIEVYKYEVRDAPKPLPFHSRRGGLVWLLFAAPCCLTGATSAFRAVLGLSWGSGSAAWPPTRTGW